MIAARFEFGNDGMATDGAIDAAKVLLLQGRMAEAEALYRDLLGKQPDALCSARGVGRRTFSARAREEAAVLFGALRCDQTAVGPFSGQPWVRPCERPEGSTRP